MNKKIAALWAIATSPEGGYLTNRAIRFLGHIVLMVVIMKLTWTGTITETYLGLYGAIIAGDASLAQALKTKPAEESK